MMSMFNNMTQCAFALWGCLLEKEDLNDHRWRRFSEADDDKKEKYMYLDLLAGAQHCRADR